MKHILTVLFSLILVAFNTAQDFEAFTVPIFEDGEELSFALAGGLNNPQFYNMDIDRDGEQDLLIFDRDGNTITPLIATANGFEYRPDFIRNFPKLRNWIVIADYNADGIEDIFCHPTVNSFSAIEVWTGSLVNGELTFTMKTFDQFTYDILYFQFAGNDTNVYVPSTDIPQIVDVDRDGDLDVLSFEPGGSYVWYHRNMVVEKGLPLDTFSFTLEDQCWGKFFENDFSQQVSLSASYQDCATPFTTPEEPKDKAIHSGSTLLAFDADGDTDLDMILGDLSSDHLVFLENQETQDTAWMIAQDQNFPSYDVPVKMNLFLSSFYVDVDQDGKRDLVASPNKNGSTRNDDNVWFYENIGTDESPVFEYRRENLFVGEMIDLGENSHPEFVDVNADGLMDIVVGCNGEYTGDDVKDARLVLYLNTGSIHHPTFTLTENDYLSMNQYKSDINNLAPAFGDIDGDLDIDLVVGDTEGFLTYYENIAGPDAPFEFATPVFEFMNINPGTSICPQIFDYNGDGLGDLLIGESNGNNGVDGPGSLNYFENIGTVGNPVFDPAIDAGNNTNTLGLVNTLDAGQTRPNTDVHAYETEAGVFILAGSSSGEIELYQPDPNDIYAPFTKLNEDYGGFRIGGLSRIAIADLNANGTMEMLIGNRRGGLLMYNTDIPSGLVSTTQIEGNTIDVKIVPTLTNDQFSIVHSIIDIPLSVEIYDARAQLVLTQREVVNSGHQIDVSSLASGLYFVKISNGAAQITKRIVKN